MEKSTQNVISKKVIDSHLLLSGKDIATRLGAAVLNEEVLYCAIPTKQEIVSAITSWITKVYTKAKSTVCKNKEVITGKRNNAAYALVDLLLSLNKQIAVVCLSIAIVDYGVEEFCAGKADIFVAYIVSMLNDKEINTSKKG